MLENLEKEALHVKKVGAIRAIYSFEITPDMTRRQRRWVLAQQTEFAQVELEDQLRGQKTQIAGGQGSLFTRECMAEVAGITNGGKPWDEASAVEDSQFSRAARACGYKVLVSQMAHANVGPMLSWATWFKQRVKWTAGHLSDITRDGVHFGADRRQWSMQAKMGWDFLLRLMLLILLPVSLAHHMFVFRWWWALPTAMAIIVNMLAASKMRVRRGRHVVRALAFLPAEIYLWRTLAVWVTSVCSVVFDSKKNHWHGQRYAEDGKTNSHAGLVSLLIVVALVVASIGLGGYLPINIVAHVVRAGWIVLSILTIGAMVPLTWKMLRILRKYRSLSL